MLRHKISVDERNYNVTNRISEVLNNVNGFDVATGNPRKGTIIARYDGVSFFIDIKPIFNNNAKGKAADSRPFSEVVKVFGWIFR